LRHGYATGSEAPVAARGLRIAKISFSARNGLLDPLAGKAFREGERARVGAEYAAHVALDAGLRRVRRPGRVGLLIVNRGYDCGED